MPDPTKDEGYLPCWAIVPAGEQEPAAGSDDEGDDHLEMLQKIISWIVFGLIAITICELAQRWL